MVAVAEPLELTDLPEQHALPSSGDVASISSLILSCNKDGMEALRAADTKTAFEQFKYAEAILLANSGQADHLALHAVTCNNLGCYYKKVGKYHGALSYLRRALKMEVELSTDEVTLAGTHLNLCAVLSKLEKHDKAVQHGLCALDLMNKCVKAADTILAEDDYAVLAIAYHNIAMEREYLQQWDQSAAAYQTGYQVAKRFLGENHPLTLTLGSNCEAVLTNVKNAKAKKVRAKGTVQLPAIASAATPEEAITVSKLLPAASHVPQEADDWASSEEALWVAFANKILAPTAGTGASERPAAERDLQDPSPGEEPEPDQAATSEAAPGGEEEEEESQPPGSPTPARPVFEADEFSLRLQQRIATSLSQLKETHVHLPRIGDLPGRVDNDLKITATTKQTPLGQAMDDHPEAMLEILDAEREGNTTSRAHSNDFRPNRSIKRQTRTARVVRRTGISNSTAHRDKVEMDRARRRGAFHQPWMAVHIQTAAATKIQDVWRKWFQYCQDNAEYMTMTWICATMVQSHWRSYRVRRQKMDVSARVIQRVVRGFLVRRVLKNHKAAVAIQRIVVGTQTRAKMVKLREAAIQMQRLVRGGLARRRYTVLRRFKNGVAIVLQRYIRAWLAKRRVEELQEAKRIRDLRWKVALTCQRFYRGWKGRERVQAVRAAYYEDLAQREAAVRIQAAMRRKAAVRTANGLRDKRLQEMTKAATFLRKMWLGAQTRRRYLEVQGNYSHCSQQIVTLQRYSRGFIVRLRLWNQVMQCEEEKWAATQIQRSYRGYRGRVKFENKLEEVWKRELSAALLQRCFRGYSARARVNRSKRETARSEFERARRRFKGAQKIQAVARGFTARRRVQRDLARVRKAAIDIQRIYRGHKLRAHIWTTVQEQRATVIAAIAKGYLVRRRLARLVRAVVFIQCYYRRWLRRPKEHRDERVQRMLKRKQRVIVLQRFFRVELARRELLHIKGADKQALATATAAPAAE
mmetsp:Transcript_51090/g.119611  ORF Transcript_51090/g.119611 Transcript_51090/m.119611 type:complete len:978 (+) Transcript_51090:66-2999(+)